MKRIIMPMVVVVHILILMKVMDTAIPAQLVPLLALTRSRIT